MMKNIKKGFTLVELIVVIAIITVLMLIIVPTMNGFVATAENEANYANARAVYSAMVAQDTSAKAGLGTYSAISEVKTSCSESGLHADFYDVGDLNGSCSYVKSDGKITKVTYNNVAYPKK